MDSSRTFTISLSLANPEASHAAVIFTNAESRVRLKLRNESGADIPLDSGSGLEVYLPQFFSDSQVRSMSIIPKESEEWEWGWHEKHVSHQLRFKPGSGVWAAGDSIEFQLSKLEAAALPQDGFVQVNPFGFRARNIPVQLYAYFNVEKARAGHHHSGDEDQEDGGSNSGCLFGLFKFSRRAAAHKKKAWPPPSMTR